MKKRNVLLTSLLAIGLVACNNSTSNHNTSSLTSSEEKWMKQKLKRYYKTLLH